MKFLVVVCVCVAVCTGAPQGDQQGYQYQGPQSPVQQQQYPSQPAQYNFQYQVEDQDSGNYYGHQEERDGDNTQGSYFIQLPDTRLMRVEYYADATGYHPTITYEGEAQYQQQPSQQYSQPSQQYFQPSQ